MSENYLVCLSCGREESEPFAPGDGCSMCGAQMVEIEPGVVGRMRHQAAMPPTHRQVIGANAFGFDWADLDALIAWLDRTRPAESASGWPHLACDCGVCYGMALRRGKLPDEYNDLIGRRQWEALTLRRERDDLRAENTRLRNKPCPHDGPEMGGRR